MKKSIVGILMVVLFMCADLCLAVEKQRPCPGKSDYQAPEGKKEQWAAIKRAADKEYAVCVEH